MKNKCELKRFKTCAVYPRVKLFWIYTTVNFFKTFSPLPMCVYQNTQYYQKKKQWVNPILENEYELKKFKVCAVYPRVRPFWIYTTVSFFKKTLSPLPLCVLKNTQYSQKKKQWVNPTLENECKLKRFKTCAVYPRVRHFWIYTTVSFFKKPSPLFPCVC